LSVAALQRRDKIAHFQGPPSPRRVHFPAFGTAAMMPKWRSCAALARFGGLSYENGFGSAASRINASPT